RAWTRRDCHGPHRPREPRSGGGEAGRRVGALDDQRDRRRGRGGGAGGARQRRHDGHRGQGSPPGRRRRSVRRWERGERNFDRRGGRRGDGPRRAASIRGTHQRSRLGGRARDTRRARARNSTLDGRAFMSERPSWLCLGASVVAHAGLLALLFFFFVSDDSFSSPLIIDLSALDTTTESASKLEARSERPATAGVRGSRARAGSGPPDERVAAAPVPPMPASPTVVTPAPELVRPPEREVPVSKPEPREPDPSPAIAAPREPAAAREPVQDDAPSVTTSPVAGTNPAGTVGSSADGAAGTPSSATSGGTSGGSGSRVALAPGGTGGEPGSEYGGYLAGVRRRIQESIQYPTSARRRG